MSAFADDNFVIKTNKDTGLLKISIETSLTNILAWMKASGLKVNETKTEICLFSRSDVASLNIVIKGVNVTISREINVLGVVFDAKLQWGPQVKRALYLSDMMQPSIRVALTK